MLGHLSEEKLLDMVEGTADAAARRHVAECPACGGRVAEAGKGLITAEQADVPEPSPLYWEAFRQQVGRRIDSEPIGRSVRVRFLPALAALAATVAVAIALNVRGPQPGAPPTPAPAQRLPAWTPLPASEDDIGLSVIEALAPSAGEVSALNACPVEDCLASLSDEESRAVAESLRQQLSGRTL